MGERVINIRDLIVHILLHWRSIILCMFVGGIVSGLFGYIDIIQSFKANEKELLEQSDAINLQSEMTQKELTEVEQVLLNEFSFEELYSYVENSAFMNLDAFQVYEGDLVYTVTTNSRQTVSADIYVNLLDISEMYQFVADRIDNFTASDIQELTSIKNLETVNQEHTNFSVVILAGTKEACTKIAEVIKVYVQDIHKSITKIYGTHNIICSQDNITETNNMTLLQQQIDVRRKLISLQTEAEKLTAALSRKQSRYYQLRIREINGDKSEDVKEIEKLPNLSACIQNAGWGIFFSALIYVMAIFFWYILNDKLRYTDNCMTMYHVLELGHIPAERTGNTFFKRIDQKLYLLRDKRKYTASVQEAVKLTVAAIKIVSQKKGIYSVYKVGCSKSSKILEKVQEGLKANNIEFQDVGSILYNADSMNLLSDVHAVILVEKAGTVSYSEIQRELEILRQQEINILGIVIIE